MNFLLPSLVRFCYFLFIYLLTKHHPPQTSTHQGQFKIKHWCRIIEQALGKLFGRTHAQFK
ncbi:hypothetical protein BpHYR1_021509 [Brachionus plicatilis]|uniref:Uncharacterized protein n=1 Tax=Brachionus plicatilis TaxID=10195 RepID=A0A3M7Q1N0_BRAPC|nr:hypothetical protein BpHYR1_021509 [Brachionus plicatilis]